VTIAAARQQAHRIIQAPFALRRRPIPHALQQPVVHGAVGRGGIRHAGPCCEHRRRRWRAGAGAVDGARGEATHELVVRSLEGDRVGDLGPVLERLPERVLVGGGRVGVGVAHEAEHWRRDRHAGAVVVPDGSAAAAVAAAPDAQRRVPEVGGAVGRRGVAAAESPDEGAVGAVATGQGGKACGSRSGGERVQQGHHVGPERGVGGGGRRRRGSWRRRRR
jgi:hypothetical protein